MRRRSRLPAKPQDDTEWGAAQKSLERATEANRVWLAAVPRADAAPAQAPARHPAFRKLELPPPLPGSAAKIAAAVMALRRAEELYQEARDQLMIATTQRDAGAVSRAKAECAPREEAVRAARTALQRVRESINDQRSHAALFGGPQVTERAKRQFAKVFDEPPPRPEIESRSMTREEYARERHHDREQIRQVRIAAREHLAGRSNGRS